MSDFQRNKDHQERNATQEHARTSGMAVASLVLSILAIYPLGLIFGILALRKIKRSSGILGGRGLALAGIIISSVGLFISIIIISLMAAVVSTKINEQMNKDRVTVTRMNLRVLHDVVNQFRMDVGRFPTEEEGLTVLVKQPIGVTNYPPGGYLQTTELPKDAWGGEFVYQVHPTSGKPFVVMSFGADGRAGGEGLDADLYSTGF